MFTEEIKLREKKIKERKTETVFSSNITVCSTNDLIFVCLMNLFLTSLIAIQFKILLVSYSPSLSPITIITHPSSHLQHHHLYLLLRFLPSIFISFSPLLLPHSSPIPPPFPSLVDAIIPSPAESPITSRVITTTPLHSQGKKHFRILLISFPRFSSWFYITHTYVH